MAGAPAAAAGGWTKPSTFRTAAREPVPRAAIAADGTRAVVWSSKSRALVISAGDSRGRMGSPRVIDRKGAGNWSLAAQSRGAVLVAWEERDGVRVAVRTRFGRRFRVRRVATSLGSYTSVQVAADPRGGWAIAESRPGRGFTSRNSRVRGLSLDPAGRRLGPVQDLGPGKLGADALAVDGAGRALLAFTREGAGAGPFHLPPVVVTTRPHGGAFAPPVALPGDLAATDPRAAVGPDASALVAFTRSLSGCPEVGCSGAPAVVGVMADGALGPAIGPRLRHPGRAFAPSAALTSTGGGVLVFLLNTKPSVFSTLAPVRAVAFGAHGRIGKLRTLTTKRAGEPVVMALSRRRALALWVSRTGVGTALARSGGRIRRTPAPPGPPPRILRYEDSHELRTAGRYAIFAWSRAGVVRISVRRF